MDFKQELLGEFVVDELEELHVQAWRAYHLAAEKVDGHYLIGNIPGKILRMAVEAGYYAMGQVDPGCRAKYNHRAKIEALRQLEKEGLVISEHEKIRRWRAR